MVDTEYTIRKLGELKTTTLQKEAERERMARSVLRTEERGSRFLLHFLPRSFQLVSRLEQE